MNHSKQMDNGSVELKGMKMIKDPDLNDFDVDTNGNIASGDPNGDKYKHSRNNNNDLEDGHTKKSNPEEFEDLYYIQLFRYSRCREKFFIFIGLLGACGVGCGMPINFLIFGNVLDQFIDRGAFDYRKLTNATFANSSGPPTSIYDGVFDLTKLFLVMAGCLFVAAFLQMVCWQYSALQQAMRIRIRLFKSMLYQDVAWHDTHATGDLVTRLSDQVNTIQLGIGEKMAVFLQYFATFLSGMTMGFVRGWKLSLVVFAGMPLLAISISGVGVVMKRMTNRELRAYGIAGSIAEEVLYAIRTVVAFGGEKKEASRYRDSLKFAERAGIQKALMFGLTLGFSSALIYAIAGLCFWYGGETILNEKAHPGVVIQVFFCTFIGGISLGNALQSLEEFWNAKGAAGNNFPIMRRKPKIDIKASGEHLPNLEGRIEFRNVKFTYPTRPDVQVLHGFSFSAEPGQTVALVGESGSGKSTVMQLVQRFYDSSSGEVLIDGRPIQSLDLSSLRQKVGVVQQEPLLFAGSVEDNIRLGRLDATDEEIREAARMANAHNFIMKIPGDYTAVIGEGGGQLSGGQKQRIAIARALIRRPRILLLDEATSALDNRSEAVVQEALDTAAASRDCTVLLIAHRLTTVRNADRIIVMARGQQVEEGSHEELMEAKGEYFRLVMKQRGQEGRTSRQKSLSLSSSQGYAGMEEGEVFLNDDESAVLDDEEIKPEALETVVADGSAESGLKSSTDAKGHHKEPEPKAFPVMKRAMALNRPELCFVITGIISAILLGSLMPCFSLVYSEILNVYSKFNTPDIMRRETQLYCSMLGGAGVLALILQILKNWAFGVSGERLTLRMRDRAFEGMLNQEIGWYDLKENQPGNLASRLASDASFVKAVTGIRFGVFGESFVTLTASIVIAFVFGWKLTLVILAFVPMLILVGVVQGRTISQQSSVKTTSATESDSSSIAQESLGNIRTVISLNREEHFIQKYITSYEQESKSALRRSLIFGLFAGISQAVLYCSYAAVFTYGAKLVDDGEMEFANVFRVFSAINFGSTAMGRATSFLPDMGKAVRSTVSILKLIERKSLISVRDDNGLRPNEACSGVVKFDKVEFSYPTRPNVPVLQELSIEAAPGQTVALVGESGCGKSTLMQLVLRFYDVDGGLLTLDGNSSKDLSVNWLRSQLGLVSQEPTLFNYSIRDNIAYGDNTREIPMSDIIEVARQANIHDFITTLPEGYETKVGARGGQMSGGQKQRIAIARALVRKPTVLLLDEATSALDSDSEKVVQDALDRARRGRTCLVIAHRLSTIENADLIAVIDCGKVIEAGTHSELMKNRGAYYLIHSGKM